MYSITDLKTGVVINIDNTPYEVMKYQHVKMGRGGAMLRTTLKNLLTGQNIERTFRDEKIEPADMSHKKAQFLYAQGNKYTFMDSETFEQFEIDGTVIGFASNFLKDGQQVDLLTHNNVAINIKLPTKMTFNVIEADPATKGDTANNPLKTVKIETGLEVKTPMFVKNGDSIVVDTRDGSYIERGK
jgi:elongation factor P